MYEMAAHRPAFKAFVSFLTVPFVSTTFRTEKLNGDLFFRLYN